MASAGQFNQIVECSFTNQVVLGSSLVAVTENPDFAPAWSKEPLDTQEAKRVRDMTRTYSQMHRTDKYSEHSSIIWPVSPNGRVFVYELSGSGFESSCSLLLAYSFWNFF